MEIDFNQPQRQAPIGILLIFLNTARNLFRAFFPIILAWFLKPKVVSFASFYLLAAAFIVFGGIIAYFRYRNFTFYVDQENESFVVTEGIFNKTKTTIQFSKIQQVNINQSFFQKLINVYALEIDTAGSHKKEANIKAINHSLALALKARLLQNEVQTSQVEKPSDEPLENETPFVKISLSSLLKLGVTSNYLKTFAILWLYYISISEYIEKIFGKNSNIVDNLGKHIEIEQILGLSFVFLIVFIVFLLGANCLRIIVKFFNYKIIRQQGNLLLSFGLFNTQNTIIKPERVQMVIVSRNFFQKKLNILEIKIRQALSSHSENKSSIIEIPGCNGQERNEILNLIFRQIPKNENMMKPNFRKLGFAIFIKVILPVMGFWLFANYIMADLKEFLYLLIYYAVFMSVFQFFAFKNYRLFIDRDFIIKQKGTWDVTREIIEWQKIQYISTSQLFWHKKLNIGTLTLHTAGGELIFELGNFDQIKHYVNWWLYKLESTDTDWM